MFQKLPFNLSKFISTKGLFIKSGLWLSIEKQARRDPPTTFDQTNPLWSKPYRENKGKAGEGAGSDLLRPGDIGFSNTTPSGGAAFSDNKEWPSSPTQLINDEEGRENHDNGTGIVTDHGLDLHDDAEIGEGSGMGTGDAVLGKNDTVIRQMTNNLDRVPYNVNTSSGILKSVRKRLRSL